MKHSNQLDYLATIKKNHKIHTALDRQQDDELYIDTMWRHYNSLRYMNRLAGVSLLRPYTVAIHCYYTGLLFEDIAKYERITITKKEISLVYRHDLVETITGDVLLPVKIHSESIKKKWEEIEREMVKDKYNYLKSFNDENMEKVFSIEAFNLFKACDLFELYLFCWEETQLGNMTDGVWAVIYNCQKLLPNFKIDYITDYVKSPLE